MIRLRQVALVARDLDSTTNALCELLGTEVCYRDPGVAEFGLHNTLMVIGDQFLEVVSPLRDGTTAGRLLDKRRADVTGYMAIYEVDDIAERDTVLADHGVRVVWHADLSDIATRHLHPADVGGAIVSIDQPVPQGAWRWGGPTWVAHSHTSAVTAIAGVRISAANPVARHARWAQLGLAHAVAFDALGAGPDPGNGEGIDVLEVVASDRSRAGELHDIAGFTVRFG